MTLSSAPISNKQFRPRRVKSGNTVAPKGIKSMPAPTFSTKGKGHLIPIKRNARAGTLVHHAGKL